MNILKQQKDDIRQKFSQIRREMDREEKREKDEKLSQAAISLMSMAVTSVGLGSPSPDSERWEQPAEKASSMISSILFILPTIVIAKVPS